MVESEGCLDGSDSSGCGDDVPGGRRRDKAATKRALLIAATAVFAQRGYDAATTREVASVAGVNETLIQRYFGGKAGLLRAVAEGFCGDGGKPCTLAPCSNNLKTEIARFLGQEIRYAWEHRDVLRVLFTRAIVDPALAAELNRQMREVRLPVLAERLRHLQETGGIAPDTDLATLVDLIALLGFGLGFLEQVVFATDPDRLHDLADRTAELLARTSLPGSRTGAVITK